MDEVSRVAVRSAKATLRREVRALRGALSPDALARASAEITALLQAAPAWRGARWIAAYASLPGEVDTAALLADPHKPIALPRVEGKGVPLRFYDLRSASLVPGVWGIPEPGPEALEVAPDAIDLVVVPALAVDRTGRRLGQGGGYYDRTLPLCTRALRVAVVLDAQVVDAVPTEAHDARLDAFVTPSGWFDCPPR